MLLLPVLNQMRPVANSYIWKHSESAQAQENLIYMYVTDWLFQSC
jgi:hypothetical protein